ncbi:MAG TPA: PilZ domain-containing protein [Pseudorhodoplanes sp.]|nr:PilZ domain-containing protein [Pseudorhodoplanes sp.]
MKPDQRKTRRRTVHYPAWIRSDGPRLGECRLTDASDSGARLIVESPKDVPDRFRLRLSSRARSERQCRVIWRSDTEVGIEFDKGEAAGPRK